MLYLVYHKDSKYWDRKVNANGADPDQTALEQSDQGLHCLPFHLRLIDHFCIKTVQYLGD